MMYLITKTFKNTLNIQRSEFIAVILPINDKTQVSDIIKDLKKEYPKATHYTYAYIIGDNGETASSNDDGEPSGTAGVPILEALTNRKLTNIICVVIRYFGGIKLGVGGLIRAYRDACVSVLDVSEIYERKKSYIYKSVFGYEHIDLMNQLLDKENIIDTKFLEQVTYKYFLTNNDTSFLDEYKHLIKTTFLNEDYMLFKLDN